MTRKLIIIGAGGHAQVLVEALLEGGAHIAGATDAGFTGAGRSVLGVPVIGTDDAIREFSPDEVDLVNAVGSVSNPKVRVEIGERFSKDGYRFASVIHPSAIIGRDVELGEGAQVMAGTVLQPGVRIGRHAIINTRASVDHDCTIGVYVHIAPGAVLSGDVTIGNESHIGVGATVIQGVSIGSGCLIGAGAVVIGDVLDGQTVTGVPAR